MLTLRVCVPRASCLTSEQACLRSRNTCLRSVISCLCSAPRVETRIGVGFVDLAQLSTFSLPVFLPYVYQRRPVDNSVIWKRLFFQQTGNMQMQNNPTQKLKDVSMRRFNLLQQNFLRNNSWLKFGGQRTILMVSIIALLGTGNANAGAMTNSATETTQILNNIQLVLSYQKQVDQYIRQGLQYKTQLQNLIAAPGTVVSDVLGIVNGIGEMLAVGKSIGGSLAEIDKRFAGTFKNPIATQLANNFVKWNQTSSDTLEAALKAAGMHRDKYPSDQAVLQDLYQKSQSTNGALDSLQMLSAINSEQINQLQKLGDLMAAQNIAASTYKSTVTAKNQGREDMNKSIMKITPIPKPNSADFVGKP